MAFAPRSEILCGVLSVSSGAEPASHMPGQDRMQPVEMALEARRRVSHGIMQQEVRCGADRSGAAIPRLAHGPRRAISANARSPHLSVHREL